MAEIPSRITEIKEILIEMKTIMDYKEDITGETVVTMSEEKDSDTTEGEMKWMDTENREEISLDSRGMREHSMVTGNSETVETKRYGKKFNRSKNKFGVNVNLNLDYYEYNFKGFYKYNCKNKFNKNNLNVE